MSTYSFYRLDDGLFTGVVASIPERSLAAHLRDGIGAKRGRYDCRRQRVDVRTGEIVAYVEPQPPTTEFETFVLRAGVWVSEPTVAALWRDVRAERDRRLAATDWRVMVATERGEPVPPAWQAYRQALRDVTLQADPRAVTWPESAT